MVSALDGEALALSRVALHAGRPRREDSAPGAAGPPSLLARSLAVRSKSSAGLARSRELRAHSAGLLGRGRAWRTAASVVVARSHTFRADSAGRRNPRLLEVSPLVRMKARLATMPVIEQAKGILIAQAGCSPDDAFDLLRRASQRSNVPIRDLAARLVQQNTRPGRATSPQPPSRRPGRAC
jgi:hypothetical protein